MESFCRKLPVFLLTLLIAVVANVPARAATSKPLDIVKKLKDLHDSNQIEMMTTLECRAPGLGCSSSADCCGASMCTSGYCSDTGTNNLPPGGHCQSSGDCAGASMCTSGFCSDPGTNNLPPGSGCASSGDCAGASMCTSGFCSDPGTNNLPPGSGCASSGDCAGASMCVNNICN